MKIIACLGNPEKRYSKTRHNIGFIIGEALAENLDIKVDQKSFSSLIGTGKYSGEDIIIMFPQTYMNKSGDAVQKALSYYKIDPGNLIVIHDEIELPFGEYKIKFGGGHKGHNGIRSITQQIGSADFHRIRFGVGRPENPKIEISDYVLSKFFSEEIEQLKGMLPGIYESMISLIESD